MLVRVALIVLRQDVIETVLVPSLPFRKACRLDLGTPRIVAFRTRKAVVAAVTAHTFLLGFRQGELRAGDQIKKRFDTCHAPWRDES